jgi:hypothetical protein
MTDAERHPAPPSSSSTSSTSSTESRHTIPRPPDDQSVYRVDENEVVSGAERRGFDVPATIAGALAALGTLLLLSSIAGAIGSVGYQSGLEDDDLSIGGLVAGLVILVLAGLVGGWVAARIARRRGALHGLVAVLWLVVLAAVLAGLAAIAGDSFDIGDDVGLPTWFDEDSFTIGAIITGVVALLLLLLGGFLGGKLGDRGRHDGSVTLVETRHAVSEHRGGIVQDRGL